MEVIEKILYKDERATLIKNIIAIVVVTGWAKNFAWLLYYRGPSGLVKEWKTTFLARFFRFVKSFAIVQKLIKKETGKIMDDMKHEVLSKNGGESFTSLPAQGTNPEQLQKLLDSLASLTNPDHLNGKASGSVYHGISELTRMTNEAYRLFSCSNPLHPDIFPGVRKMEAEIVSMVIKMFNGGSNACGTTTSGGTESILMACKAMRDWGLDVKGITEPEIVIPVSAHAAFDKAAHYFKIKLLYAPVDEKTRKVDIKAVKRMVTPNTVMIVGSAPSFPHGVIDDIQELAKIARRNKIGLHVDSCLGGFLVPFMEKAGFPLAPFDFRVEGVTSISCDTHKYGFAPKGSSVVMYSSPEYRKYQYFVAPDWPGGIYASPTIAGSRPGALIAGCWAALMYMGEEGYVQSTKSIVTTARKIASAIQGTPGLKLYGEPEVSVVAFGSDEFNVYRLGHELGKRGWNLNSLQYPASLHICCTQLTASVADKFISDVAEITSEIMKGPKDKSAEGMGAIYGMASAIPDRSMVDMLARGFIDSLYSV